MTVMLTLRGCAVFTVIMVAGVIAVRPAGVSAQQQDVAKGAAVLAEARKALGGEDKLAAIKRLQVNGASRRANGNFNLEGDTEVFLEPPDKFRRNESLTVGGGTGIERTEGLNGTEFWNETSGDFGGRGRGRFGGGFGGVPNGGGQTGAAPDAGRGAPSPETLERLRDFQRRNLQSEVSRLLLAILLTSDAPVAWIGTAQAPEGSADVLEVKTADGAATRMFIDTATHMPLMLTWTGQAGRGFAVGRGGRRGQGGGPAGAGAPPQAGAPPSGDQAGSSQPAQPAEAAAQGRRGQGGAAPQPVTLEMHLSEYKAVNGVKFPHLITRGVSGETNEEWIIKSYKINPNLKANTFTR